jgi:hypothetical protein
MTRHPSPANASAAASPMPLPAPVTTAVRAIFHPFLGANLV